MSFDLYSFLRPLLFRLPPERAHSLALSSLQLAHRLRLMPRPRDDDAAAVTLMGLRFPNRVGLAAGFDKNGRFIDPLGSLGFGFIEVGTVTPRPQSGQPLPRLFRLPAQRALINRMGFPNDVHTRAYSEST
jgi:dihydroorotate dehydrogenase